MVSDVTLSALRKMCRYAPSIVSSRPMRMEQPAMMSIMMSDWSVPFLMRFESPAPRFCAVKLVIAEPRPLSGVISRLLILLAAPKPFCAAFETMMPPSISN